MSLIYSYDLLYATELKLVREGANPRVTKPETHKPGDRPRNTSWKYRGVTVYQSVQHDTGSLFQITYPHKYFLFSNRMRGRM